MLGVLQRLQPPRSGEMRRTMRMPWERKEAALAPRLIEKLRSESYWAARWCILAWAVLSAFLLLLLIGHVFSARFAVVAAVPFAFGSALLHVIAMSELGSVYFRSRDVRRTFSDYSHSDLHDRTKRGALLAIFSQYGAFMAVPLAQLALLNPWLWLLALAMSGISLFAARYAGSTSGRVKRFTESNSQLGVIWL